MSLDKYYELQDAVAKSKRRWKKYEEEAGNFYSMFIEQLAEYLGCSTKCIKRVRMSDAMDKDPDVHSIPAHRMMLLGKDAFWCSTIHVTLPEKHGYIWLREVAVKKDESGFMAKFADREFPIKDDDLTEFIEYVYRKAIEYLENEFFDFVHGKLSREIGFKVGESN